MSDFIQPPPFLCAYYIVWERPLVKNKITGASHGLDGGTDIQMAQANIASHLQETQALTLQFLQGNMFGSADGERLSIFVLIMARSSRLKQRQNDWSESVRRHFSLSRAVRGRTAMSNHSMASSETGRSTERFSTH